MRQADEIPEVPAPPPSDACREIERLQGELADLHDILAIRDDDTDAPLLELAAARVLEGSLHRELKERLTEEQLGLLCDWLEQSGDSLGQSTLAGLLSDLLPVEEQDEPPDSEQARGEADCPTCTCERDGYGLLERIDPDCPAGCKVDFGTPPQSPK